MQPNHLNPAHALLNGEQACVTPLQGQGADRDQRWKILVLPMQKADSFRDESGGKISAAKIADLNRPGEAILQCFSGVSMRSGCLLSSGNADVLPKLADIVERDAKGPAALHALRTMQGLGAFAKADGPWAKVVDGALVHPSPGVRRAALDCLPRDATFREENRRDQTAQ